MYTLSEKIEIIQNAGSLREVQDSGIMPVAASACRMPTDAEDD